MSSQFNNRYFLLKYIIPHQAMHKRALPGYAWNRIPGRSKCGQLSMGSNDGMHLIFPVPCLFASGEVGPQLPATGLEARENQTYRTALVSIDFRPLANRREREIFSWSMRAKQRSVALGSCVARQRKCARDHISSMLTAKWLRAVREGHAGALAVERGRTRSITTSLYPMLAGASNRRFGPSQGKPLYGQVDCRREIRAPHPPVAHVCLRSRDATRDK
jgi:hypothetical protein